MTDTEVDMDEWVEQTAEVRDTLAGDNPSPLELLMCEQVAIALLDYSRCALFRDARETFASSGHEDGRRATPAYLAWLDKRADRSHRRLMSAIKTLAAIRRVPVNAIQINVGGSPR